MQIEQNLVYGENGKLIRKEKSFVVIHSNFGKFIHFMYRNQFLIGPYPKYRQRHHQTSWISAVDSNSPYFTLMLFNYSRVLAGSFDKGALICDGLHLSLAYNYLRLSFSLD